MDWKVLFSKKNLGNFFTILMFGMLLIAAPWVDKGMQCENSKNLVKFCDDKQGRLTCVFADQNPNGFIPANQDVPYNLTNVLRD